MTLWPTASKMQLMGRMKVQMLGPSAPMRSQKMFSEAEVTTLVQHCCHEIIVGGIMTKDGILSALQGTGLPKRYTLAQLVTRLSYERRKLKPN